MATIAIAAIEVVVTEKPLQFAADGKHLRLFRPIDKPKPIMSSGYVTVQRKDEACRGQPKHSSVALSSIHSQVRLRRRLRDLGSLALLRSLSPSRRHAEKNAFFGSSVRRAQKKAELIAAAAEGKAGWPTSLGTRCWKTLDETTSPLATVEKADKEKAQPSRGFSRDCGRGDCSSPVVNAPIPAGGNDDEISWK